MPKTPEEYEAEIASLKREHEGQMAQLNKQLEVSEAHAVKLGERVESLESKNKKFEDEKRKALEDEFHALPLSDEQKKVYTPEEIAKWTDTEIHAFMKGFESREPKEEEAAHSTGTKYPKAGGSDQHEGGKSILDTL